jgi:ribosomal protein S18 acetylase RimI-like enzyme
VAEVLIRPLQREDLPAVTRVHIAAFSVTPLTLLGDEAVRRYYDWLLVGPHDVTALGAYRDGRCVGFSFGGVFRGAMTGFLKKNRSYLAVRALTHPWLLARAPFRARVGQGLRILGRRRRAAPAPDPRSATRSFGILSIAVHPESQGSGAGQMLMKASEVIAVGQGFRSMHLSVHPSNARAVRFYEGLGWQRHSSGPVWTGSMRRAIGA